MDGNLDITVKKEKRSWFDRRRHPFFSSRRIGRCGSKKKHDRSSSSSFEPVSSASGDSSKMDPGITVASIHSGKGEHLSKNHSLNSGESTASNESKSSSQECSVCLVTQPIENFPQLTSCQHRTCLNCLRQYLSIEISESRVNLTCPECQEKLHPADVRSILDNEPGLLMKWEEFMLRHTLSTDPDCRWCPAPDCGYAVIAYGCASCPRIECQRPGCNTEFCYHCRQEWHHNQTCDSAFLQRTHRLRMRTNSAAYSQGSILHDEIKPCPKCGALIVKMNDGSCNHMTCTVCEAEFCWLCLQEINDLHYLSPSGCTFWGKKPWSRKKKILWQLGLLIGAPVGISLVAGVAVPAIIFGVPVWVARRVYSQLENRNYSKHKRNLAVASCAIGSLLLSPALAALVVGLGVPVMLLFVYGVVPFSLCRSGSSGHSSRGLNTPGTSMLPAAFRLDLGNTSSPTSPASQDEGTTFHGQSSRLVPTNPSIGEASVGGITMGSFNTSRGSNIDKIGRIDPDGASTMAMAGTSITGSLSGISGAGPLGSNRMENPSSDVDQHSTHTQVSVGSASGVTAVQVHMSDNISDNSTSSFPTSSGSNNVKRAYSSKSLGAKRKTKMTKRSASVKATSSSKTVDVSVAEDASDATMSTKQDNPHTLTIVNECETIESKSTSTNSSSSQNKKEEPVDSEISISIDSSDKKFPKVSLV